MNIERVQQTRVANGNEPLPIPLAIARAEQPNDIDHMRFTDEDRRKLDAVYNMLTDISKLINGINDPSRKMSPIAKMMMSQLGLG